MIGTKGILVSGGTGYLGRALVEQLLARGHEVAVLVRPGSEGKVPSSAVRVGGNALVADSFREHLPVGGTLVHLTGTPHPAPWKKQKFRAVDLVSLQASVEAARQGPISHFVYVSVAQPAPVMRAYIAVRQECEAILAQSGLPRTILRPWYVLGPGHRWPAMLRPVYAALEAFPVTRAGARRLGLVTLEEMVRALVWAVEHPPEKVQVLDVPAIRSAGY